jgi:hypothetical protein
MIGMADSELQAYLGELHDAAVPACVDLARMMRTVYGVFARREPHYFATLAVLKQLGANVEQEPAQQLAALCGVADSEVRNNVAAIWRRLYATSMALGERTGSTGSSDQVAEGQGERPLSPGVAKAPAKQQVRGRLNQHR